MKTAPRATTAEDRVAKALELKDKGNEAARADKWWVLLKLALLFVSICKQRRTEDNYAADLFC